MDKNKLEVLRQISYQIQPTCSLCTHGQFNSPASPWGTCQAQTYDHLKHSDSKRNLSIHKAGTCGKFEFNQSDLGGFREFLKEGS